jgi:hypothetical protein
MSQHTTAHPTKPASEQEEIAALDRIERELGGVQAEGVDLKQLCKQYNSLKGTLQTVVGIINKVPVIGSKLATAVKFVMQVADVACVIA